MGWTNDASQVRGDLFKQSGKWGYTVQLDYSWMSADDWEHWDLWTNAQRALREATKNGTSGVTMDQVPSGWTLVILEPYGKNGHPISIKGSALSEAVE